MYTPGSILRLYDMFKAGVINDYINTVNDGLAKSETNLLWKQFYGEDKDQIAESTIQRITNACERAGQQPLTDF